MKNILGIIASPRKGGNTDSLIREILKSANEYGSGIDKVYLYDYAITPCNACNSCKETKNCIHDDDFEKIIEKMKNSSVWIIGTPVYWWGPSAQLKAFIDRWYGVERAVFRDQLCALVIPSGGSGRSYSRHVVGMLEDIFSYLGIKHQGTILASGHGSRGSVLRDEQLMSEARDLGKQLAGLV